MDRDWTEQQIVGFRARLAEAKRQGLWLSALETRIVLSLITWWQQSTMTGYRRPNDGRLPTLGELRADGVTHVFVSCVPCGARGVSRRLALSDLHMPPNRTPVPDHATFRDLPNLCRFRCTRCGARKVSVVAHRPTGLMPDPLDRPDPLRSTWNGTR